MRYPWLYDDMKQIGTDYEDEEEVEAYDRQMGEIRNIKKEIDEILDRLDLQPHHTLIEIGTGTGEMAIAASKKCSHVMAIDISKPMLRFAEKKARSRGAKNITFHQGGFLSYIHRGDPVDVLVSQLALHHLPDFWKQVALLRLAEMLRVGGKLFLRDVIFTFEADEYFHSIEDYLAKNEKVAPQMAAHIRDEFSTFHWVIEGMLERAGFSIQEADQSNGLFTTYICIKR